MSLENVKWQNQKGSKWMQDPNEDIRAHYLELFAAKFSMG